MKNIVNSQLELAFDFLEYTNTNIFLTGKAGTGKTTFLHNLKKKSLKRMIVVAPTGVAAINAGGVTIHSFFQISFGPQIPENNSAIIQSDEDPEGQRGQEIKKFGRNKISIIKSMDLLVIDEISMVRADLLDAIDAVLRRYKNRNKPFGGVQLLMIGDLQQLAPVVRDYEWSILNKYYETAFFFSSIALQKTNYVSIELKHIYRQKDDSFIEILNKIRDNKMDAASLIELNKRFIPGFSNDADEGYIILTTHNAQAQKINESKLQKIKTKAFTYTATIEGEFPEYSFPTDPELTLKKDSQVMFIKNDLSQDKLYYNGKIGKITRIDDDLIYVLCPGDPEPIFVQPAEWSNVKYTLNETTTLIEESVAGKFSQYPLKLAWAITIHKSQGLTFDKAIIDANLAFAHGQVYVALSRCKTLEGMVLSSPLTEKAIITNHTVSKFNNKLEQNPPGEELLNQSKINYQRILFLEQFDFKNILYQLLYIKKNLKENAGSVQEGRFEEFTEMSNRFKAEISDVSEKFEIQLNNLFNQNIEIIENQVLQERVIKASIYFLEKTENILQAVIEGLEIDSDNKVIRKLFKSAQEKLEENLNIKITCLKASTNSFKVSSYLEARAKASVQRLKQKDKEIRQKPYEHISKSIIHPVLYLKLKEWRDNQADEANLPFYMVLPQKTIVELANNLPQSLMALKSIKGFGKKKITSYGKEILSVINKYCEENNIEVVSSEIENLSLEKPVKINTKEASFNMFQNGMTIEKIASERGMSITTIEGHLAHFIGTGKLNVEQFVTPAKMFLISEYFKEQKNYQLNPAKHALGEQVNYSDLKFVLKHLEFTKNV